MAQQAIQIHTESVSAVTATPSEEIGTRRIFGNEEYLYVYNGGNSQISKGFFACATATSGYTVTVSTVTGQGAMGVCKHATLTTGTYGWLLTRGFIDGLTNVMANSIVAAGVPFNTGVDGKVSLDQAAPAPAIGIAMTATGSAGVFNAYVRLFG